MRKVYIVMLELRENVPTVERVFASEDKARQCANKLRDLYECVAWVDEEEVE